MNRTLYVVCVIFNPRAFKSRYRLYRQFAPYVAYSGAQLLTVEIAYRGRDFVVTSPDNPWHLQLCTEDDLWHKERGLNLGFQHLLRLAPDARYLAWIDADVNFSNPHWVRDTVMALDQYHVVQPYSEAQNLNPDEERMWSCPSTMKQYHTLGYHQDPPKPLSVVGGGHPGLAWAIRREVLDQLGGLLDICVAGSADTYMANAFKGDIMLFIKGGMSAGFRVYLERYAKRCDRYVGRNIGFVPGICFHHWHGKSEQRGYEKRWDIMCFHQFDPYEDVYTRLGGLLGFAKNKPFFESDLTRSMSGRNEDSIDL